MADLLLYKLIIYQLAVLCKVYLVDLDRDIGVVIGRCVSFAVQLGMAYVQILAPFSLHGVSHFDDTVGTNEFSCQKLFLLGTVVQVQLIKATFRSMITEVTYTAHGSVVD